MTSLASRAEPDPVCARAALALLVASRGSPAVRSAALAASLAMARRRPAFAADLFYCVVYRLRAETDPPAALGLLRALPELAVNKVSSRRGHGVTRVVW